MNFIPTPSNARADFRKIALPVAPAQAGSYLLNQVQAGTDVALAVDNGHARDMLDEAAGRLADTRTRVLRAAPGTERSLTLSSLVSQIAGQSSTPDRGVDVKTKGYRALTQLDQTCDRIALLVSDAQALDRNALDYLKLVRREQSPLSLVLAGSQELFDILDEQNVSAARARVKTGQGTEPPLTPAPKTAMDLPAFEPPPPEPSEPPEPPRAKRPAPSPPQPLYAASAVVRPGKRSRPREWSIALTAFASGIVLSLLVLNVWFGRKLSYSPEPQRPAASLAPANPAPVSPAPAIAPLPLPKPNPAPNAGSGSAPSTPDVTPPAATPTPLPSAPASPANTAPPAAPAPDIAGTEEINGIPIPPIPPSFTNQQDSSAAAPQQPGPSPSPTPPQRQPRNTPLSRPQPAEGPAAVWDDPYSTDQSTQAYQPAPAPFPPSADVRQPPPTPPYIGTFTTDAAGNRVFRLNR